MTTKGIGAGAAAYYIVTPDHAWLISQIDLPSSANVTMIPTDQNPDKKLTGERIIAHWLVDHQPTQPVMIGKIGNANPTRSFVMSYPPHRMQFCDTGGNVLFDLSKVTRTLEMISPDITWLDVKKAIRAREEMRDAQRSGVAQQIEKTTKKVRSLLKKMPELKAIIQELPVRPESGEWQLLDWYFRER